MFDKKINKSKIIINGIAIVVIIAIIVVLTIKLTNRKQAVNVSSEGNNVSANTEKDASKNENQKSETWEISKEENSIDINKTISQNNIENINQVSNQDNEEKTNQDNNQNNIENTNKVDSNNNEIDTNQITNNTDINKTNQQTATNKDSKSIKGVIWLTFDDGPSSTSTPKVLDILKKENIKATFFILNYSKANEDLVKREAAEGHTIGIHGYSHEYSKIYKSKEAFLNNIYTLQDKIYKSTGVKTMHMRFPGGSSNTVSRRYSKGIMTALTKEVVARGFKYYDWNISSGDAGGAKTSKDVYNNVTKNLSKKRGNMVLCHDFAGNKKTIGALEDIIKYGKKNGYTFASIDENTPMYGQHINN